MAQEVGTSRQNIENLEAKGFRQPQYIAALAKVMQTTVDDLLGCTPVVARHAVTIDTPSADDIRHTEDFRRLSPDDRAAIDEATQMMLLEASALRRKAMQKAGMSGEAAPDAGNSLPRAPKPGSRAAKLAADMANGFKQTPIVFGVMLKRKRYIVNTAGEAYRSPTFARGIVAAIDDELRDMIQQRANQDTTL